MKDNLIIQALEILDHRGEIKDILEKLNDIDLQQGLEQIASAANKQPCSECGGTELHSIHCSKLSNAPIPSKQPVANKPLYWSVWFHPDGISYSAESEALFSEKLTESQAEAIKQAIEHLLDFITKDFDGDGLDTRKFYDAREAHQSIKREKG